MDNAHQGLEGCAKPVYYPVRESDAAAVEKFRLHKIQDTLQCQQCNSKPVIGQDSQAPKAA